MPEKVRRAFAVAADQQRWILFIVTAALGLFLDLGTKEWAFADPSLLPLGSGRTIPVIAGWFDIQLSENRGAAFGILYGNLPFFLLISAIAFVAIVYFIHVAPRAARLGPALLGLIFAGVAGNFFDRCVFTKVRDFLYVHAPPQGTARELAMKVFGQADWPNFNLADAYICVGAIAIVIGLWRDDRKKLAPAAEPAPSPAPGAATIAPSPDAKGAAS
jgi:signal peptidase II